MFTLNYYKMLSSYISGDAFSGKLGLVMCDGSTNDNFQHNTPQLWRASSGAYAINMNDVTTVGAPQSGVMFGTGDTAPTPADYKLAGNVLSNLTATITRSVLMDNVGFSISVTYNITNSNDSEVTIKEVGLIASKGQWDSDKVLVERSVLDVPVTIAAGGIGQIVYTIELPFPTV